MTDPFLSIVVVSYQAARELPKTLYSLSPAFQQGVSADDYEVIVVDNGSRQPPKAAAFADLGLDLTVLSVEDPTPSPVRAMNLGLDASCGAVVGAFVDGARLASPGLIRRSREAIATHPRAVVGSRGRYLGPMMQRRAMRFGYDQALEDEMLERIDWKHNGYELFNVSVFDETSRAVWHSQVAETNALFMRRAMWRELGGFDPAFDSPGGGFVNLDTWNRACHLPDARPILLLGEATFHQFHGGVATNRHHREVVAFRDEYIRIRGKDYERPAVPATFWGSFTITPHEEEFIAVRGRNPRERMVSGPMAGLLDLGPDEPATTPATGAAAMGSKALTVTRVRVVSSTRLVARRLPPSTKRALKAAGRRLPPDVRRQLNRALGRRPSSR